MKSIVFIDTEISIFSKEITDLGAVYYNKSHIHTKNFTEFSNFISNADFISGHNIIHHDLKYMDSIFKKINKKQSPIDTLYLSALLFPCKPYHKLVKDDKLQTQDLNNPLNDAKKSMDLFFDELYAFDNLRKNHPNIAKIYCSLLYNFIEFQGFFEYIDMTPSDISAQDIINEFDELICTNSYIDNIMNYYPIELAYSLALIKFGNSNSITPPWILKSFPYVENILKILRFTACKSGCKYCNKKLDVHNALKTYFGYDDFRKYNDENLQEQAVIASLKKKSLIAIFPTGGGKSITFQLPAIMAGASVHSLTVIISPLQSLMKDQVDNLEAKNIIDAVTINGMLSPLERSNAINRVLYGSANLLYISPEQLRSNTIEKIIMSRTIERFVIDEAHCFSAWGHDFRVDYLYISDFIKNIQKKKSLRYPIPVSCFTATAKQKVISDIKDYFKNNLNLELDIYATDSTRENLSYFVLYKETEDEKYSTMRDLIIESNCPTIVYTSRTRKAEEISEKLNKDGIKSRFYHGKMDSNEKIINQDAFIKNEVQVIVATSAFGMGVDKDNVALVIHYDISNSLENYVQEAGRAGRNPKIKAKCYVLFNDNDLDKHFSLLNQTKLNMNEIQQIYKAIKDLTKNRKYFSISPIELARQAGFDENTHDIETRIKTAIGALENAGYIKRGKNSSHIYATSILVKNMQEASNIIENSDKFTEIQKQNSKLIIQSLISSKNILKSKNSIAQSRIDYLSDILGITKQEVISCVNLMREQKILADTKDMSVKLFQSKNKSKKIFENFKELELYLLDNIKNDILNIDIKTLNESAMEKGILSTVKNIRTIFYYWFIKNYIQKSENQYTNRIEISPKYENHILKEKYKLKTDICEFAINYFYNKKEETNPDLIQDDIIKFSLIDLFQSYSQKNPSVSLEDIENSLLYLSKIACISLEGGFLVIYNTIEITRLKMDNREKYKLKDYSILNDFYKQKIQQVHIIGEYANMIVKNYEKALEFVRDYFQIDFKEFIKKYFGKEREREININISKNKYSQIFSNLSDVQAEIINDDNSKYIVVAAGPGSGKTLVLVHKLASLLLLEDIKQEQLLMLTFSRAAATEFKKRLRALIGSASNYVQIKTFHSYCFDLLGTKGNIEKSENIIRDATKMIINGDVEISRITKSVIVIDEAQDMDEEEFELIEALIWANDDLRVIAVGDDDQNIYEFRGSDNKYFKSFINKPESKKYEMITNYRSKKLIVEMANKFVKTLSSRMKTNPCISYTEEEGNIHITKHKSSNIEQALVSNLIKTYNKDISTCILTNTNEESLKIACLLKSANIHFKLIQSNNGFKLYDLAEIRYFIKHINKDENNPKISEDLWAIAKEKLINNYKNSLCLENCINILDDFETTSPKKYKSDLEDFINESNYEDFYTNEENAVIISTIHKSKGREFDNVYLLMDKTNIFTDDEKRKIFVGLTRGKDSLFIHYNNDALDNFNINGVNFYYDNNQYDEAKEIILQLSHKDIVLDFFKHNKSLILKHLYSGYPLEVEGNYIYVNLNDKKFKILKFSKKFVNELETKKQKGYCVYKANIRFILAWQPKEEEEIAIILPDLYLKKY